MSLDSISFCILSSLAMMCLVYYVVSSVVWLVWGLGCALLWWSSSLFMASTISLAPVLVRWYPLLSIMVVLGLFSMAFWISMMFADGMALGSVVLWLLFSMMFADGMALGSVVLWLLFSMMFADGMALGSVVLWLLFSMMFADGMALGSVVLWLLFSMMFADGMALGSVVLCCGCYSL